MRKLYLIILIGILWAFGLAEGRAQHQVVTGRLVLSGEQEKEEVLSYANVAVLGLPDSLLVKGTSSDKTTDGICIESLVYGMCALDGGFTF